MNRAAWLVPLFSSLILSVAGCADGSSTAHRAPPKDPPDYHGVPTDVRPPAMTAPSAADALQ